MLVTSTVEICIYQLGQVEQMVWLPYAVGLSAAVETLVGILKRVIVNSAIYPCFLEIAELVRSLCHIWATCLVSCLNHKKRIIHPALQTMLQQQLWQFIVSKPDHEDEISDFWTDNSHYEPDLDCRQCGSVEEIHSREQLAVQQVTCELAHCREEAKHSMTISPDISLSDWRGLTI